MGLDNEIRGCPAMRLIHRSLSVAPEVLAENTAMKLLEYPIWVGPGEWCLLLLEVH